MYDPQIQRRKTTLMQRIQQAATRGYFYYVSGEIRANKVIGVANKFAEKYKTDINENQRSYRKRKGNANALLFLYPKKDSSNFYYWLLATDGNGEIHEQEKLIKIFDKSQRLSWDNDYELVTLPKKGSKHTVTWRMTRLCYQSWNDRIRKAIRQKYSNDLSNQAIWSLSRVPGFSGIRDQVKKLYKLFNAEWKRTRAKNEEIKKLPPIGYVRGIKSDTYPLSLIVKRQSKGLRPFPNRKTKKVNNQ